MFKEILILALCVNFYPDGAESAKILALMNIGSPSHSLWNTVLMNGLAAKGHNVTVLVSNLPRNKKDQHPNVRYFLMEEIYNNLVDDVDVANFIDVNPLFMMYGYCEYSLANCRGTVTSKGFQQFMKEYKEEQFDLILYDYLFGPCLMGLVHTYNYPPVVSVSAFPYLPSTVKLSGGHFYPSYVNYHSALFDLQNSFTDRIKNHIYYLAEEIYWNYVMVPQMDKMVREYFPKNTPSIGELEKRSVLTLVGSHPVITKAQPIPQNVIEVGGLNLIDAEPLPKELDDFIASAKKGAVLFSLGTNTKPKDYRTKVIDELLDAMEKYSDYHFMWKFDTRLISRKIPKNVMVRDFFPQRSILANPKVKCFVTHSGGLSTQESIWYGVPMVTVPVYADQLRNSDIVVQLGFASEVKFLNLNGKTFDAALNEILNNPKYMSNIQLSSRRFRDRPMKPLDTAVWWIEYVLRDPNPDHLRVPTEDMGFFLANSYDFIALVLALDALLIYLFVKLVKCLCCSSSKTAEVKKLKKK